MFDFLKEKPLHNAEGQEEGSSFSELEKGYVLQFGPMKQPSLHRKRFTIQDIWTYNIDLQKFYAFVLEKGTAHTLYFIVGEQDGEQYLAISQRVPLEKLSALAGISDWKQWLQNASNTTLRLSAQPNGKDKHWLSTTYKRVMSGVDGHCFLADFRGRLLAGDAATGKKFQYFLLVSQDNQHALDCELYEDGTLIVYATLYRPAGDIRHIIPAPSVAPAHAVTGKESTGPLAAHSNKEARSEPGLRNAVVKPLTSPPSFAETLKETAGSSGEESEEKTAKPVQAEKEVTRIEAATIEKAVTPSGTTAEPAEKAAAKPAEHKTENATAGQETATAAATAETTEPAVAKPEEHQIAKEKLELDFEVKLAGILIEEASRNQMTLEGIIRRVLGMPVDVSEHVHFKLDLSRKDIAYLSERYDLPAEDMLGIRHKIVHELADFAGNGHPKKDGPVVRGKKMHAKRGKTGNSKQSAGSVHKKKSETAMEMA